MQIKTILNRVRKFKSFVYGAVCWVEGASVPTLEVEIQPRLNSRPVCSGYGQKRPGYDRLPERRFEFIPMWGNKVFCFPSGARHAGKTVRPRGYWGLLAFAVLSMARSDGFRTYHAAEIALYHTLGVLPVPKTTREFF